MQIRWNAPDTVCLKRLTAGLACNSFTSSAATWGLRASLCLRDIYMPVQDGLETIMALRKEYPAVRIIAISGGGEFSRHHKDYGLQFIIDVTIGLGADCYLLCFVARHNAFRVPHKSAAFLEKAQDA